MFKFYLILCFLVSVLSTVLGEADLSNGEALPSWITSKPAFQRPTPVDSKTDGHNTLTSEKKGDEGWLVTLNEKEGYGVELELEKLSMNPDKDDFLLVMPYSPDNKFERIKLYTGNFDKPLKKLRIPNTKKFLILYSVSSTTDSPAMILSYRRYGSPLEMITPPIEDPLKKKETIYEIQLKGKAPGEYVGGFLSQVKEGIRASAKRFCAAHNINFNESIPTDKMVLIHRKSFCPFEWPDRDICISLEHSVFVSGVLVPNQELILDYELTKDNLKKMWSEDNFPELQELGITVFQLPPTGTTIIYWALITGLMILSALIIVLILQKLNYKRNVSDRKVSNLSEDAIKIRKPKFKLHKHQRVPSFISNQRHPQMIQLEGQLQKEIGEQQQLRDQPKGGSKVGETSKEPIGNYLASKYFASNAAFEDDDEVVEFRKK